MADQAFDDRDGWIRLDGRMVAWRVARAQILTQAPRYASSAFKGAPPLKDAD